MGIGRVLAVTGINGSAQKSTPTGDNASCRFKHETSAPKSRPHVQGTRRRKRNEIESRGEMLRRVAVQSLQI